MGFAPLNLPFLNTDFALSNLMALIDQANDQQLCHQLNITRKDALLQAIDVWAVGALRDPDAD